MNEPADNLRIAHAGIRDLRATMNKPPVDEELPAAVHLDGDGMLVDRFHPGLVSAWSPDLDAAGDTAYRVVLIYLALNEELPSNFGRLTAEERAR